MRPMRPRISATISGPPARPEANRLWQAGKAIGSVPSAIPSGDADKERDEMRLVKFLERIADGALPLS